MFKLEFDTITDIGKRNNNEDYFIAEVFDDLYLLAVTDGLGAHSGSELASQYFCESLKELYPTIRDKLNQDKTDRLITEMQDVISMAAEKMAEKLKLEFAFDAKTTCAVALLNNKYSIFAHIGDTRIYRYNASEIFFRTIDDSLSQQLVAQHVISESKINHHPSRHVLLKCLGTKDNPVATVSVQDAIKKGEALLICTDGFWENMPDSLMQNLLLAKKDEVNQVLHTYIQQAKETVQGLDNMTAVFARVL